MKIFFLIFGFISLLFSANNSFINPNDAFKVTIKKYNNNIQFKINLDKSIYIYDEFLKVYIQKPKKIDITNELKLPKPKDYHKFMVHFGEIIINVPIDLIQTKVQTNNYKLKLEYQGCSTKGLCYSPMSKSYTSIKINNTQNKKVINEVNTITQTLKTGSFALILITFFGFGLLLAFTPCIFPMIPILSGIIVQHSKNNNHTMSASKGFFLSLIYVLSMSIAYTIAGILAGLFGANIQIILQNPYVIVLFVIVFIALAFSMFGYYEIALPQSWQTKLNKTSDENSKNGIFGIAIMGFLSALIVGPCVAPPLAGALVYIGQTGDAFLGGLALFVMSIGMGLPLLLIGAGSGKFMPKAGGWMTIVSKVFGVIMLGVAIWMLDKIVPQIITMILFIILFLSSALYMLKNSKYFITKIIATLLIIISIFLIYTTFKNTNTNKLHFKYIKTSKELETIVKNTKKPIMIDFWATWCTSCLEFDNITFKDKLVQNELKKYLLLKIDVSKNTKEDKILMKKFNLFGPPAMIFYQNNIEQNNKQIIGYKSPKEFLKIIK